MEEGKTKRDRNMKERIIHLHRLPGDEKTAPNLAIRKAELLLVEEKICDGCNRTSTCATVSFMRNIIILCQDCVEGILDSIDETANRDRKPNNIGI
jgi:hypothetical protein